MFVRILSEPENSQIKQYKALFAMEDVTLEFSPESLTAIAKLALQQKIGVRGLRTILVRFLFEMNYFSRNENGIAIKF